MSDNQNFPVYKFLVTRHGTLEFPVFFNAQDFPVKAGSHDICKIQLNGNSKISRVHAVIELLDGEHPTIVDLGSGKGTYVNSTWVHKCMLQPHDNITIGDNVIQYVGVVSVPIEDLVSVSTDNTVAEEPSLLAASFTERLRRMYEEAVKYGLEFDSATANQKTVTFVKNNNSTQVTYYHDTNASRCKYHQIVDISADAQTSCRITIESTGSNYESCYKNAIVALSGITHPQDVMATLISNIAHRDNN